MALRYSGPDPGPFVDPNGSQPRRPYMLEAAARHWGLFGNLRPTPPAPRVCCLCSAGRPAVRLVVGGVCLVCWGRLRLKYRWPVCAMRPVVPGRRTVKRGINYKTEVWRKM